MTHIKYLLNCKKFISLMILFSFFDNFGMEEARNESSQNEDGKYNCDHENKDEKARKIQVSFLGDSGVGKTCILLKLVSNKFNPSQISTVALEFQTIKVTRDNQSITLQIWDNPGQEKLRVITKISYRQAQLIVLVYSVTDKKSFESLGGWLKAVKNENSKAKFLLVGNKIDLGDSRAVSKEEGENFAKENGMNYFEGSAKNGTNISEELFVPFIKEFLKNQDLIEQCSVASKGSGNSMKEENTNSSFCDECCSCCPCLKNSEGIGLVK